MKNADGKGFDKVVGNLVLLSSRVKINGRMMLGIVVSTLFPRDLSALGVKASVT